MPEITMTANKISIDQMRQHVRDLCETNEICLRVWPGFRRAYALSKFREITIAPIKSAVSYAIALHEIGHILGRYQGERHRTMAKETWAWKWARSHALLWTPAMERNMRRALDWYAPRATRIDRKLARYPSLAEQWAVAEARAQEGDSDQ